MKGFNDFASRYPKLAEEWSENNKIAPDEVTSGKAGFFLWHCSSCGREYKAWICSRIRGSGCPYCSGRVTFPALNGLPVTDSETASKDIQKICRCKSSCIHERKVAIYDRTLQNIADPEFEQEFICFLPKLLVLLYAGRNRIRVLFDSEELTGLNTEIYIPEFQVVIERGNPSEMNREQKIKAYICAQRSIRYILSEPFKSAAESAVFIREIFKQNHVYIRTEAKDDIALCREKYQMLARKQTKAALNNKNEREEQL